MMIVAVLPPTTISSTDKDAGSHMAVLVVHPISSLCAGSRLCSNKPQPPAWGDLAGGLEETVLREDSLEEACHSA